MTVSSTRTLQTLVRCFQSLWVLVTEVNLIGMTNYPAIMSWKSYLNVIIAVHDVTAFGTPSLANSYFCIYLYSYQILIRFLLSDPDDVTVFIIFNGFSIMKTTYDFTYRTIIRHQRSQCKYQILNVQSQS